MQATIVHMAQTFVGANNVPLLEAAGQFGTRLQVCPPLGRFHFGVNYKLITKAGLFLSAYSTEQPLRYTAHLFPL
jgi:hypothetical protein